MTQSNAPSEKASPSLSQPPAKKRVWSQPGFVIAVVILAFSAVGMNAAIAYLDLWVKKLPARLVKPLGTIPDRVGNWKQVSIDEPLNADMEEQLATKDYIYRFYVDASKLDPATMASFEGKSAAERRALVGQIQKSQPELVMYVGVTYYTGKADTVAHIPERCYAADGFDIDTSNSGTVQCDMGPGRLNQPADHPAVPMRYLKFVDATEGNRPPTQVAYFFFANGHYESDSLRVRQTLENLRHKHAFYSKVELSMVDRDNAGALRVMSDFLKSFVPEVEKCYPDFDALEAGKTAAPAAVTTGAAGK